MPFDETSIPAMSVAVSGSSGFIGRHLCARWNAAGYRVVRIVRREGGPRDALWNPKKGVLRPSPLEALNAVVHLAGEPIGRFWTPSRRRRIIASRSEGTRRLCEALVALEQPPRVLVSASAVGYYGDRGDERLTERSPAGEGFLAEVSRAWEKAADPARQAGIRVVHLRQGMVLGRDGGALKRMLRPFQMGVGGRLGNGRQYWSWIGLYDLQRAYDFAIEHDRLAGAVNATAPEPVSNDEFSKTLGRVLDRPSSLPVAAVALRLRFGEMAGEALLSSQRAVPERLSSSGFEFDHPDLETALRAELSRPR